MRFGQSHRSHEVRNTSIAASEPTLIDIATTKIIDSRDPGGDGDSITTFFAEISGGKLMMSIDATLVDSVDRTVQAAFDFKYDTDTE